MILIKPIKGILQIPPFISNLIKGNLQKKYKTDININEVKADVVDGKIRIHLNADCGVEENELTQILKDVGLI